MFKPAGAYRVTVLHRREPRQQWVAAQVPGWQSAPAGTRDPKKQQRQYSRLVSHVSQNTVKAAAGTTHHALQLRARQWRETGSGADYGFAREKVTYGARPAGRQRGTMVFAQPAEAGRHSMLLHAVDGVSPLEETNRLMSSACTCARESKGTIKPTGTSVWNMLTSRSGPARRGAVTDHGTKTEG